MTNNNKEMLERNKQVNIRILLPSMVDVHTFLKKM